MQKESFLLFSGTTLTGKEVGEHSFFLGGGWMGRLLCEKQLQIIIDPKSSMEDFLAIALEIILIIVQGITSCSFFWAPEV